MPQAGSRAERAGLCTPRILQQHLVDNTEGRWWVAEGTVSFVDISGFTKLSEGLARKGREGSVQITYAIGRSFEAVLAAAYDNGASLIKFGGDALRGEGVLLTGRHHPHVSGTIAAILWTEVHAGSLRQKGSFYLLSPYGGTSAALR